MVDENLLFYEFHIMMSNITSFNLGESRDEHRGRNLTC